MIPLGVYIHWPYCRTKCRYCDFNSRPGEGGDWADWLTAYRTEWAWFRALCPGRPVDTVFFGGGTPSLMDPRLIAGLLETLAPRGEVSLEANPTSADQARFRDFRAAGVTRLSLGIQALNDSDLAVLGRTHSTRDATAALDRGRSCFERVSFDLIWGRPGQTPAGWEAELKQATALADGHLSLYQLDSPVFPTPSDDDALAMFAACHGQTLPGYEISNFARPGQECRHNLDIWQGADYIGLGPGAHGRLGRRAFHQIANPERWRAAVARAGHGSVGDDTLTQGQRAAEIAMLGLRLTEGLNAARFGAVTGLALSDAIDPGQQALLTADGLIETTAAGLRVTPRGRVLLNAVTARLLVG